MPRKPSTKKQAVETASPNQKYNLPNDAPWGGFVNIKLSDEQKDEFFTWVDANVKHYPGMFTDMLGDGLKVSFSFDAVHDCFICSIMGALMGSTPGSRFCSTSRAGTLAEVTALTVWKHYVLAQGDYGNYRPKDSTFMNWG